MAHRQSSPKQQKTFAASAAFLVTAAIISAPALAATSHSIPCVDIPEATLDVSSEALIAAVVSHDVPAAPDNSESPVDDIESVSPASLLAPRAEAAIRDAFDESDRVSDVLATKDDEAAFNDAALPQAMLGSDTKSHTVIKSDSGAAPVRSMTTKLPGVSDVASSRYKKQMFRRDI